MGDTKLYLLLLLCSVVLADDQDDTAPCFLDKRYKSFNKYEYLYESDSLNFLNEAVNGLKVSCKVEIEVPRTCHYIVHTKECILSEAEKPADGNLIYKASVGADTFNAQMEKNPIKFIVEDTNEIKLFPEDDELINILNIKKGIISALAVPGIQKKRIMPTIYGMCETEYTVDSKEDVATDITFKRDLSRCDQFKAIKDHTSPLALITGMNNYLTQFIRSNQTCNYKFDSQQKHMISGVCTEDHSILPFSQNKKYGIVSFGKQFLSLLGVSEYNERLFNHNEANMKTLHLDTSIDMSPVQDDKAILDVLRELSELSQTSNGQRRAYLAHKLVTMIRKANADTLSAALPEALSISPSLTYQALFQCGTPECSSTFLKTLRNNDLTSYEIDAVVYAMGMLPNSHRPLVKEILEMAKFKPSKLIYYATSNAVRRLYQAEGKVTPEIQAVADYLLENIGDCTGEQEHIYLTLRVIGNMAAAMGAASPALTSAIVQCINQPAASAEVQQAAIQVFRTTAFPEKDRPVLLKVLLDGSSPVQKRIAAYLILMKEPSADELSQLVAALNTEGNLQAKSFFNSHLTNILSSTAPETTELKKKILSAFQGNEIENVMDPTKFSRNYKIGSVEGNMIFENEHDLPKEVMLEMTLSAFGYDIDMVEVGMEGKGLEPTVEALLGQDGFFPDTVLKTIYFATDMMPSQINEILESMIPAMANDRKKRQAYKNIVGEIGKNVNKLFKDLKAHDAPEAMVYLRLLGAELGYLKSKDLEFMAYSIVKMAENLMKTFPTEFIKNLFSSANNDLFLHYIFMDNEFYLPTGPGVPLRFALSGTVTPGLKGGLQISRDMSEIAFMPSAGVELVTEIGVHLPDYVESGAEMHTSIYHESGVKATVAIKKQQIKLTIPAPTTPAKIIDIRNSLVSVSSSAVKVISSVDAKQTDIIKCTPMFPGLELCGTAQYTDSVEANSSPCFLLTGDSKFAVELKPTGKVTEYTATVNYAYVGKMDKITLALKAEGEPFEATSNLIFNRQTYSVSMDVQIPEYDIETGIQIGPAYQIDESDVTHSIQIDLINKKIPEASLIGLAKLEAMNDAWLNVRLLVPSLVADAKWSATVKEVGDLSLELESDIKFLHSSLLQRLAINYDKDRIKALIKSDISTDTSSKIRTIKAFANSVLKEYTDIEDITVHDLMVSQIEKANSILEASKIPFLEDLKIPSFPDTELCDELFLKMEAGASYHFNEQYYTISISVPHGGKSLNDLAFPPALSIPKISLPQIGLTTDSFEVSLPEIFIPEALTFSFPKFEKAELSGKLNSNLYNLNGDWSAERDFTESPSYSAKFNVIGTGAVDVLSIKADGSAVLTGIMTDTLKAEMKTAVSHKLINAKVNIVEELTLTEKIILKSSSKLEAVSPLGLDMSLEHTGQVGVAAEEISGDSKLKGSLVTGPFNGDLTLTQSIAAFPFKPEAMVESSFIINSVPFQGQSQVKATFANGELSVMSTTAALNDMLKNTAEVTLMRSKFAAKSTTKALILGLKIQNIAEAGIGAGDINIKIETTTSNSEDHINSMIVTTINKNGLIVNSDASIKVAEHTGTHKASLNLNKNGLATSGSTSVNSFLTLDNTFEGIFHTSKASLSVVTKGKFGEMAIDNSNSMSASFSSFDMSSKSRFDMVEDVWYIYDASVHAEPYSAHAKITNNVKLTSEMEMKHTCEIRFADLTGTTKCSATGKLLGAHLNHDTELEVVGPNVKVNSETRFNSRPVRFTTSLQGTAGPFQLNLHAIANGDGELNLYGKHSAQVYTKVLLKAEPLSVAHSHECRVSVTHKLSNDVTLDTNFDNKVETLLSPSVQSASIKMNSKVNSNVFTTSVSAYNNQDRIGLEVSGEVTNSASRGSQDYSMSAFLKYDKNTEMHVISLPLLETLPAILEKGRITTVSLAEALQDYINREEFAVKLQALLQQLTDFITELDLEQKTVQLKNKLIAMAQQCPVNKESLEAAAKEVRIFIERIMADVSKFAHKIRQITLEAHLDTVVQAITALNEKYDIHSKLLALIETMEGLIDLVEYDGLKFYDTDIVLNIKTSMKENLEELKHFMRDFDIHTFSEFLRDVHLLIESIFADISEYNFNKIVDTVQQLLNEMDIIGKCETIRQNVRAVIVKYELNKKIDELLKKIVDLVKQFNVQKTVQTLVKHFKSTSLPFAQILDAAIIYLKSTEVRQIIENVNELIEAFVSSLKSFEYNQFVDEANQKIKECTAKLNSFIVSLELQRKLDVTKEFLNNILSCVSNCLEKLRETKVSDVIKIMNDVLEIYLNVVNEFAKDFKRILNDVDLKAGLQRALEYVSDAYTLSFLVSKEILYDISRMAKNIIGPQPIITEMKQIILGFIKALETAELEIPSFTVPLTDLVVPSKKFRLDKLQDSIPSEFNLPQFTILGTYTVPAMTLTYNDIKEKIFELIDCIINFRIHFDDVLFGEFTLNYLPELSGIRLPEMNIPQISLPALPKLSDDYIPNIPLQIPELTLPKIPTEVLLPAFGKLYSEIAFRSPYYTIRTSAEIRNSTDNNQMHHFTASFASAGKSPDFTILNYDLDVAARIGIPKMSRVVLAESINFIHSALSVEHQASLTLYGLSAQATAQTKLKANTNPYTALFTNNAYFAVEGGMSASFNTNYNHQINLPFIQLSNEAAVTQSVLVVLKDTTVTVTVRTTRNEKYNILDISDEITHKSELQCTIEPMTAKINFTGTRDSDLLNLKETLNVDAVALRHIDFKGRIEAKSPFIKNSVVLTSGRVNFRKLKAEVEATHDTELTGAVSGTLSNGLIIVVRPIEITVDFQNKGNLKISKQESLFTKIDLQNDYTVILNSNKQHISTIALMRFNQNKYNYNFTVSNGNTQTGIYAALNGEADLEFLTVPFSIPEITIPGTDIQIPAIHEINLYENSGLSYILSTKPALDLNTKIVYQKSKLAPIVDFGLIYIPAVGNLKSEMSFKSSILNLIASAGVQKENDPVIRIAATSTSVYQDLNANFEATSTLTFKRGLKLATAVSLKNAYIEGTHNHTLTLNSYNLDAAVAVLTVAKMNLPILRIEANHRFLADTKTHPNAMSTLKIIHKYDIPLIETAGNGELEYTMKVDGTLSHLSAEYTAKGMIDETFLQDGTVKGSSLSEASMYINGQGLRSKLKVNGNLKVNYEDIKVEFDIDENLDTEAALRRVYIVRNSVFNHVANIYSYYTKGKQVGSATFELIPLSSLSAEMEYDLQQSDNNGDTVSYEKTVVNLTPSEQKFSYTLKGNSPDYNTNTEVEGTLNIPHNSKIVFKSSATSTFDLLDYNINGYLGHSCNEGTATAKVFFKHNDVSMDFSNVFAPRELRHEINVDLTSPIFTDVKLHYEAKKSNLSGTISTPLAGLLGFQLTSKMPFQLTSRLYGRYPSVPGKDVDILFAKASNHEKNIHLQADYNLGVVSEMIVGLEDRIPAITSAFVRFAEKYGFDEDIAALNEIIVDTLSEAHTFTCSHLSQLSVLFRNAVDHHQKTLQNLLNAVIRFLREAKFKLPGMEESTLSEICKQFRSNTGEILGQITFGIADNLKAYHKHLPLTVLSSELHLPWVQAITGDEVLRIIEDTLYLMGNKMKDLESLDVMLEKLSEILWFIVENTKEFANTIKMDILNEYGTEIDEIYDEFVSLFEDLSEDFDLITSLITISGLNVFVDDLEFVSVVLNEFTENIFIEPTGRFEIILPTSFNQ